MTHDPETTAAIVRAEMTQVAADQGKRIPELTDDLPLLESGLDSLCIAILVARLDDRLGLDPFASDGPIAFPVTVGDFIAAYRHAA